MDYLEFKNLYKVIVDDMTDNAAPSYSDYEISEQLTSAQELVVLEYYNPKANKYREGFERTEKRRKELQELIEDTKITSFDTTDSELISNNSMFVNLPTGFMFAITEQAVVSYTNCNSATATATIDIVPVTHDEYTVGLKDPYRKPRINYGHGVVWRMDYSRKTAGSGYQRHELITDGTFTITQYNLRYIRRPNPIIVGTLTKDIEGETTPQTCELSESLHRTIVRKAAELTMAAIGDQRLEANVVLNEANE